MKKVRNSNFFLTCILMCNNEIMKRKVSIEDIKKFPILSQERF